MISFNTITSSMGQNLESLKDAKPLSLSGGLNISSNAYKVNGIDPRQDALSWTVNANLNLNFYGIVNAPFSAHFSNNNHTYNQPSFNHFGISPSYKAITVHVGYRSLSFSPYTYSGVTFLGGAIDIKPKSSPLQFSFFYGQFGKAVAYDTNNIVNNTNNIFDKPGYARTGWGGQLRYEKETYGIGIIIFKAKDHQKSIPTPLFESGLKPQENFVIGLNARNQIGEHLNLSIDYAMSAYTSDTRDSLVESDRFTYINNFGNLFQPRFSSTFNHVVSTELGYEFDKTNISFSYKRVDPEYKSLGTTFLSNDMRDILINISRSYNNEKINTSGNFGHQRNNLNNNLMNTNNRIIGGLNIFYNLSESLNFSLNYANFNSNTTPASISVVDTFRYVQVTKSTTFTSNYSFGNDAKKNNISFLTSIQNVNTLNRTAIEMVEQGNVMVNTNLAYSISYVAITANLTVGINHNYFGQSDTINNQIFGPTLSISKSMLNRKLRPSLSVANMNNISSSGSNYNMLMIRLNTRYKLHKQHSLKLSGSFVYKKTEASGERKAVEMMEYKATLTYNYIFKK